MNIESEESTMNSESQSLKVVAGVFAALATVATSLTRSRSRVSQTAAEVIGPAVGPMPKA
jgi:hypothetical protein